MNPQTTLNNYLQELKWQDIHPDLRNLIKMMIFLFLTILFYVVTSKRRKRLEQQLNKITGKSYYVYMIKDDAPNAFCFGGFGKHIFYTSELEKIITGRELLSVCLHEIGHIRGLDSIKGMITDYASLQFVRFFLHHFGKSSAKNKVLEYLSSIAIGAIVLSLRNSPGILIGKLMEYKADEYTVKYGYAGDLVTALEKLKKWSEEYYFRIYGHPSTLEKVFRKIGGILDVHPEIKDRVERLLAKKELYEAMIQKNAKKVKEIIAKHLSFDKEE